MKQRLSHVHKKSLNVIPLIFLAIIISACSAFFEQIAYGETDPTPTVDNTFYFVGYPDGYSSEALTRKELARYNPDTGATEVILDMTSMNGKVWLGSDNKIFIKGNAGINKLWIYDTVTHELITRDLWFYSEMYRENYDDYAFASDNKMYFTHTLRISSGVYSIRIAQYDPITNVLSFIGAESHDIGHYYGYKAGYKDTLYFNLDGGGSDEQQLWRVKLKDGSMGVLQDYIDLYGIDTSGGVYAKIDSFFTNRFRVKGYPVNFSDNIVATNFYDSPDPYTIYYRLSSGGGLYKYMIDPTTWTSTTASFPYDTEVSYAVGNPFNYEGKWYTSVYNSDTGLQNILKITDKNGLVTRASISQYQYISVTSIKYGTKLGIPGIEVVSPIPGQKLGNGSTFIPTVKVRDLDGDSLTLTYYVDSESLPRDTKIISNTATTQLVSFNELNVSGLTEGAHTLKFTANDGNGPVEKSIDIIVDKSPPIVNGLTVTSSDTSIAMTGSASDAASGLDANPYRYTVGTYLSSWTASTTFVKDSLTPNTAYNVKFEARDGLGQTATREDQIYTKAQTPAFALNKSTDTSLTLSINDSNPSATKYQINVAGQYVSQSGTLSSSPEWITVTNKTIAIVGLTPNTNYTIQAKAQNNAGVETSWSTSVQHVTLPVAPENVVTDVSQRSIRVSWQAVSGITGYDIEADGVVNDNGASNQFIHNGLTPTTQHSYRVRGRNAGGTGSWSGIITVSTLPDPPPTPGSLSTTPTQTEVTVTWDIAARATEYELEVDGKAVSNGNATTYVHGGLQPLTDHTYRIRARNIGGVSSWSQAVVQKTLPYPPNTPDHVAGQPLIHDVTLTWDITEGADAYEVESDGLIIDNGNATTYVHDGLDPLTGHTYRVRAKNAGGKSPWSEPLYITTHPEKPITPGNVMATSDEKAITVMWYKVPHAESYDVEIDGASIVNVASNQFLHEGLSPDSSHSYRIRAKNISGDSEWSRSVTMVTLPEATGTALSLTNIVAVVTNHFITLSWDTVAPQAQYEIEVDGDLRVNGKDTIFQHTGLQAEEFHTYKVRLKSETGTGNWIAVLSLSTLPDPPDAPTEVDAFATNNSIELRWQRMDGADGYDVEVDGKTVDVGGDTSYLHIPLASGTAHTYRVRAKNMTGVTAWSPSITKSTTSPTYKINTKTDHTFELSLLAANVQDFSEVTFVVTYDPNQLDVMDLYTFTPSLDTNSSGKIPGSNLEATYAQGKITYRIQQNIVPGTSWSGEVATILFKSKVDGEVAIDVVVE